jgi:hypothetical protein
MVLSKKHATCKRYCVSRSVLAVVRERVAYVIAMNMYTEQQLAVMVSLFVVLAPVLLYVCIQWLTTTTKAITST